MEPRPHHRWRPLLCAGAGLQAGAVVGLYGSSCIDWVVCHYALMAIGCVSAPLQLSGNDEELLHCMQLTDMTALLCEQSYWHSRMRPLLRRHPDSGLPRTVILFAGSGTAAPNAEAVGGDGLRLFSLSHLDAVGSSVGEVEIQRCAADSPVLILYTSGSTGRPKAVLYPERFWFAIHLSALNARPPWPAVPRIALNYLPLSHNSGLVHLNQVLMNGGLTHFPSSPSPLASLLADVRRVQPTHLILVPRVSSLLYQQYQSRLAQRRTALGVRSERCCEDLAAGVRLSMRRSFLGSRLLFILIGTAPTDDAVWSFLSRCFDVAVHHVYGTTESWPAILSDQRVIPDVVREFKLVAVPEMAYSPSDRPNPRGELWLQLQHTAGGYYRDEVATAALRDGPWFMTGDVVEAVGRQRLQWLDRRSAIVKLAQGEFVAVSRLEQQIVSGSSCIQQIYIYANSAQPFLLAVVVPRSSLAETADSGRLRQLIASELRRIGAERQLKAWEVPRDFVLELQPFTAENRLLTESNKPARQQLKLRYGQQLEELYAQLRHAGDSSAGQATPAGLPADRLQFVVAAFASVLHLEPSSLSSCFAGRRQFRQLPQPGRRLSQRSGAVREAEAAARHRSLRLRAARLRRVAPQHRPAHQRQ